MNSTSKWLAIVAVAFVAGSFVASPELRAFAANTVGSADIINESILSEDIKNSQVKASDIAADAVGASELQGVTKLLFAQCKTDAAEGGFSVPAGSEMSVRCDIAGVDEDDSVVATLNGGGNCFEINRASVGSESSSFNVVLHNQCQVTINPGSGVPIGLVVYDK